MPSLYMFVGLPGSGKSTMVAKQTANKQNIMVYSTDNFIENECALRGWTYTQGFTTFTHDAGVFMEKSLQEAIHNEQDVYWDQTNVGVKKRTASIKKFPDHYEKNCWVIRPPKDSSEWFMLTERLANRPGKSIPDYIVRSMYDNFVMPTLKEGFDHIYMWLT